MSDPLFDQDINSTVYAFGNFLDRSYGSMVLRPGGGIAGYNHPNEQNWSYSEGRLQFINSIGEVSRVLKNIPGTEIFIGESNKTPFYAWPTLKHYGRFDSILPNIFINSIPKSGTYFLERILSEAGWRPTRLHLLDWGDLHDYRGMPDQEMHVRPDSVRTRCPAKCLGALLGHGEIVVGHLHNRDDIWGLISEGVYEIRLIRNLRSVLCSLFRFKMERVAVKDEEDKSWRNANEDQRFIEFIKYSSDKDIAEIRDISRYFHNNSGFITVKFEDIIHGNLSALEPLSRMPGVKMDLVKSALTKSREAPTPTWSGSLSNWHGLWNEEIELAFADLGLKDINRSFGYEFG